jgi:hypothetical protein
MSDPGIATQSQDLVGVFDDSYSQLFADARPMRALVRESSKLMQHPLETGATVADHRVFLPIQIEIPLVLTPETYQDTFQQIRDAFQQLTVLSVQTKARTYDNMLIEEMPHDEEPEMYDTVTVGLKLLEAKFVQAQYAQLPASKVKKKSNSSTVKTGQKQGGTPTTGQSSAAYDLIFGSK